MSSGFNPRLGQCFLCDPLDPRAHFLVPRDDLAARHPGLLVQYPRAVQQRILRLARFDIGQRRIARFDVRTCMAHQANGAHVQKYRSAPRTGIGNRLLATAQRIVQIRAIALDIMQCGALREIRFDPAAGCAHRNAYAIILAQENYRHRQMLISRPTGRIKRALRGRMVRRGITERGEDDRIMRQHRVRQLQPLRHPD